MRRTQIQLDEATYQALRARAYQRGMSLAGLIRELLHEGLYVRPAKLRLEDFQSIASGRSKKSGLEPISERHDEALAEDFLR